MPNFRPRGWKWSNPSEPHYRRPGWFPSQNLPRHCRTPSTLTSALVHLLAPKAPIYAIHRCQVFYMNKTFYLSPIGMNDSTFPKRTPTHPNKDVRKVKESRFWSNPHWMPGSKFVGNSFDAACVECEHSHSQQQVPFACDCASRPVWIGP